MPTYRKRYGYKRRRKYTGKRSKSGFFKKAFNYGLKAYKLASYLKSVINVEYKYIDFNMNSNINDTPTITCVNVINQGDTSVSRDGDSVKIAKMGITGWVKMADDSATPVTKVRVCLVRVENALGAQLTQAQIFQSGTGDAFTQQRNLSYTDNIKIVKSWNIVLSKGVKEQVPIKLYLKPKNEHVKYKGTAGTYADIYKCGYWLYLYCDRHDTYLPTYNITTRIRFIDN